MNDSEYTANSTSTSVSMQFATPASQQTIHFQIANELDRRVAFVEMDANMCIWAVCKEEWKQYGWASHLNNADEISEFSIGQGDFMMALSGLACFEMLGRTLWLSENGIGTSPDAKYIHNLAWKVDPKLGLGLPKELSDTKTVWSQFRHGLAHTYETKGNCSIARMAFLPGDEYERTIERFLEEEPQIFIHKPGNDTTTPVWLVVPDNLCLVALRKCFDFVNQTLTTSVHLSTVYDFLATGETPK